MTNPDINVHLHCAQCDSQLGIFENEWIRLTPSYARPKERGINMGCRIGSRTQVVPQGPTQKEAAGCTMVELFCEKCSTIVGQSCKTAPGPDQQSLLNQRFFKLSRIYLTDVKEEGREDPKFVDADDFDNPSRSTSVRSNVVPKQRAMSRGGLTPCFRQSYPPPSSQTPFYDPYQAPQNMPPPRQLFQQIPPSPVLVHYAPPPNNYPYAHPNSRQPSDVLEPYQPMLANAIPELQQELKGQTASVSECFNRIAATETRLASEERRISGAERRSFEIAEKMQKSELYAATLGQQTEQLSKDLESQNDSIVQNHETQTAQQLLIATQAEQIDYLTEKLTELQTAMDDLKSQMKDYRVHSLIQQSPRPNSIDFLGNLEVMVSAMRGAQAREQEVEALREKNRAMKDRLETIFAAMGSVSEEDTALLEDASPQRLRQESPVLGKRKRASDISEAEQRKLARRVPSTDARDQSLPTPESTQAEVQFSNAPGAASADSEDPLTLQEGISLPHGAPQRLTEEGANDMIDTSRNATALEKRGTDIESNSDEHNVNAASGTEEHIGDTVQESSEPRPAPPDIHQAHAVNENTLQTIYQQDSQHAHLLRESSGAYDHSAEPVVSPNHNHPSSVPRNQHPARAYGRMGSASSTQHPNGHLSYSSSTIVTPSNLYKPQYSNTEPQARTWKRDQSIERATFSHALSRGHRLEDIIQRPSRPSSAYAHDASLQRYTQTAYETTESTAEQAASTRLSDQTPVPSIGEISRQNQAQVNHNEQANETHPPQLTEFSDEENVAPSSAREANTQDKQTMSTTPIGDPRPQTFDRAEVARTIRELTQEPLRRPVIIDPSPLSRGNMYRGGSHAPQRPILPGFATAIHNLDDSAARHRATSSSRPRGSEAGPKEQWRWREPIVSPVTTMNGKPKDIGARETTSIVPEIQVRHKSPSVMPEARQISRDIPLPKPRGRPRKSSTTTRVRAPSGNSTSQNDDNCAICTKRGKLLCCDGCPKSYHPRCVNTDPKQLVEGDWFCPRCTTQRDKQNVSDKVIEKPQHDEAVMRMRRKLAEEAMARDLARKV